MATRPKSAGSKPKLKKSSGPPGEDELEPGVDSDGGLTTLSGLVIEYVVEVLIMKLLTDTESCSTMPVELDIVTVTSAPAVNSMLDKA